MRKNTRRLFVITLAIIILSLPLLGLAFGDTSVIQPPSYSFISIDIPNSSEELGFTSLADINDDGEITGGFTNSSGFGFLLDKFSSTDIQCPGSVNAEPNAHRNLLTSMAKSRDFVALVADYMAFFATRKVNTLYSISLVPILPKPPELMMTVRSLAIIETAVEGFMGSFGMLACS